MSFNRSLAENEPTSDWQTESETSNDDDDMEYELASDDITESMDEEELMEDIDGLNDDIEVEVEDENDTGTTTIYFDAEEGTLRTADGQEVQLESEVADEEAETQGDGTATPRPEGEQAPRPTQRIALTPQQILAFLRSQGLLTIGGAGGHSRQARGDDDDDEDDYGGWLGGYGSRRRRPRASNFVGDRYPPIPSKAGRELMADGTFGRDDRCQRSACGQKIEENTLRKRKRLARRVLDRELGLESRGRLRTLNGLASQSLIPASRADLIIHFNARCYSGQFSEDGSFFFACGQDFQVRMYDTSNPYDWKYYKTARYPGGQWTITDASLSPDNKLLAYSSIRSTVCLATTEQDDTTDPQYLDFADLSGSAGGRRPRRGFHSPHFGIWSLRFSGDGQEIVAGTSDNCVYVYDLESRKSILKIDGHSDDVNAVCFGDKMSPHILFSGSDDTTLKVWDRRSLASMRPAGMFLGHTEGLTYIDSKGDGRYVISNGKDQTCKLWDLRKMISTDEAEKVDPMDYTTGFDYRMNFYPKDRHEPHPHDCSLVTFQGHRVLNTLIRCHFSPAASTNGRYIYSGSHDGKVYVWNLDGTQAADPIDVKSATYNTRSVHDERYVDRYDYHRGGGGRSAWKTIVRDASWHPSAPVIAATSWNGWDHGLGTCTVHSWNDGVDVDEEGCIGEDGEVALQSGEAPLELEEFEGRLGSAPMGMRLTPQLRYESSFYTGRRAQETTRTRGGTGLARLRDPEEEEDEEDDDDDYETEEDA